MINSRASILYLTIDMGMSCKIKNGELGYAIRGGYLLWPMSKALIK